jgi:hypothetical protein
MKKEKAKKPILNKPLNFLSSPELQKGIQEKFGTLTRFCKLTKRDVYELNKLLRLKRTPENLELLKVVYDDAKKTENKPVLNEVTPEIISKIRGKIYSNFENVKDFCEKHPEYINTWISSLFNGGIVKLTPKVKKLITILEVEL